MSRRGVGVILVFVGSVVLGLVAGELYYRLYLGDAQSAMVTELAASGLNKELTARISRQLTANQVWFLIYGFVLGVAIFLWSYVAIGISRLFRKRRKPEERTVPPPSTS